MERRPNDLFTLQCLSWSNRSLGTPAPKPYHPTPNLSLNADVPRAGLRPRSGPPVS